MIAPHSLHTTADRLSELLNRLWGGNQAKMARELKLSTAVVSKVLKGHQEPGRRFLAAVAKHPLVNPTWLLTGEGEPLKGEAALSSSDSERLPVVDRLLPGPPEEHQSRILGQELWLAAALVRPTRYLYRVGDDPIAADPEAKIASRDLLLIETEPFWLNDPAALDARLVVLDISSNSGMHELRLGMARTHQVRSNPQEWGVVTLPEGGEWPLRMPGSFEGPHRVRNLAFSDAPTSTDSQSERLPTARSLSAVRGVVMLLLRS